MKVLAQTITYALFCISAAAQSGKKLDSCIKYKDLINASASVQSEVTSKVSAKNISAFQAPEYISLKSIESPSLSEIALQQVECAIADFISARVSGRKSKSDFKQPYTILSERLFESSNGLKLGILKTSFGQTQKIYANTITLLDGDIIHSYTDFGEQEFDINVFGAEKNDTSYKLYGEETENSGSLYYGKFCITFESKKRILAYQFYKNP